MMHDYAAASPRIFPHTCSLCNKECTDIKDWLAHQNSSLHLKSCTLLRQRYPKWNGDITLKLSAASKDGKPTTSTPKQKPGQASHSLSKSTSPHHQRGQDVRRENRRSRSKSPQSFRHNRRSRSISPRYEPSRSPTYRSRSKSSERRSSPRRNDGRQSPSRKGWGRYTSPPTRSHELPRRGGNRHSPPRRCNKPRSPTRIDDNTWSPTREANERQSSPRRSFVRRSSPKKSSGSRSPSRKSHERRPSREGSSNSAETLAKKLLETSAAQSLSNTSDLETVVKTLAPALLAELARMSSSSNTPSPKGGKPTLPPSSSTGKKFSSHSTVPLKAKARLQKSEATCSIVKKTIKVSPPTMVKLQGITKDLSHNDVVTAMENFGKIKSVLLFRTKQEANVCFEKEKDAKNLRSLQSLDVKGTKITVVKQKKAVTQQQRNPAQRNPATGSGVHQFPTTSATTTAAQQKPLLPTPKIPPLMGQLTRPFSVAKKFPAGKGMNKKTAVKGVKTVDKAKVLVSKAKNVSNKQITKTTKAVNLPSGKQLKQKPSPKCDSSFMKKDTAKLGNAKKLSSGNTAVLSQTSALTNMADIHDSKKEPTPGTSEVAVQGCLVKAEESETSLVVVKVMDFKSEEESLMQNPSPGPEKIASVEKESVKEDATVPVLSDTGGSEQGLKEEADVDKSEVEAKAEPAEGPSETVLSAQTHQAQIDKLEKSEARSTTNNQPDVEIHKVDDSEAMVQEALGRKDRDQEMLKRTDAAEPMEVEVTGVKDGESTEVESCTDDKVKEAGAENSMKQEMESLPTTSSAETQQAETTAEGQETKIEAGNEAAVELVIPGGEGKTAHKDIPKMDSSSTEDSSKPVGEASNAFAARIPEDFCPAIGEMLENHLLPSKIKCYAKKYVFRVADHQHGPRPVLITGLPKYYDGCYTQRDIVDLLSEFGYQHKDDKLYIIPQKRMAVVIMPSLNHVCPLISVCINHGLYLKESKLGIQVINARPPLTPAQFYEFVKTQANLHKDHQGDRTILIKNTSPSKARTLAEALRGFGSVKYFLPLLNKLFVEFKSTEAVEQFGKWYQEQNQVRVNEVIWLKTTNDNHVLTHEKDPSLAEFDLQSFTELHLTKEKHADVLKGKSVTSPKLLITSLPAYGEGSYTEEDIVELLTPFGYQHKEQNLYILPQAQLVCVQMPTTECVRNILKASKKDPITLKGSKLAFYALNNNISMKPVWFYESLMRELALHNRDTRDRVVFIRNISQGEMTGIREALRKIGSVWNFLPLLNKVFVEFKSIYDADRLGVWYSLLKHVSNHRVQRLDIPYCINSPAPRLPANALPYTKDLIEGATAPPQKVFVPRGSSSPFWITMRNSPFVFPTISPWFIIPEYRMALDENDIEAAGRHGSMCPTIMLTGLPDCKDYQHEDIAKLVWPYFPKKTLHSLYYNLIVLPLQKRAFVFFADWSTCCDFVRKQIPQRIVFKKSKLYVHFVLKQMYPELTEEAMYKSMMRWSNAGVPDSTSLDERLLCVEISEASVDVITLVVEMVASIEPFVNFLPLANRICIEMANSSAVSQVIEKYKMSANSFTEDPAWSKVQHFETLKDLKQRLEDSADAPLNLGQCVEAQDARVDKDLLEEVSVGAGHRHDVGRVSYRSEEREVKPGLVLTLPQEDFTDDAMSTDAYIFDEEQFNEEDFITIEEIGEDVDDTSPERHHAPLSRHSDRDRRRQSSSGTSSRRSLSDQKSSTRGSRSSNSSSVSAKSYKPTKTSTKQSFASTSKASSSEMSLKSSSSTSGKSHQSTKKCPAKSSKETQQSRTRSQETSSSKKSASKTSSSSSPATRENITSAPKFKAAKEAKSEQLEEKAGETQSAVAKSDHRVSAEDTAAKTVESETKIEAAGEMHPPQQEPGFVSGQTRSLDSDFDLNKIKEQKKEDGGQEGILDTQQTASEVGLILDVFQDEEKPGPEESGDMKTKDSTQVPDNLVKDEAANQEDTCTPQLLFKEGGDLEEDKSEDATEIKDGGRGVQTREASFEILNAERRQDHTNKGDEKKTKEKEEEVKDKMLSEESCKSTRDGDNLESHLECLHEGDIKGPDSDGTEQEAFEILDSIDDQMETEDISPKPEIPSVQISEEDKGPTEEEEDIYEVIDSLEDQPMEKETETNTQKKHKRAKTEEVRPRRSDRSLRRSSPTSKECKSEEKEKTPKKEDRTERTNQTQENVSTKEIVFEIIDSVEEEPPENAVPAERPGRRRSARGKKEDKVKLNLPEVSEKPEEVTYEIIDSLENEAASDEPAVVTRSTRGRRGVTMKEDKPVKEDTPTRRRQTPARESRSREKTTKKEETAPPQVGTSMKKSVSVAPYEILDSVEDEVVKDERPVTRAKGKRGRPKKQSQTTAEKQSAPSKIVEKGADEEVTYEIVDSVEDETAEDQPSLDQSESSREKDVSKNADQQGQKSKSNAGESKSEEKKELVFLEKVADEEVTYEIVDSVEDEAADDQPNLEQSKEKDLSKNTDVQGQEIKSNAGETKSEEEEEPLFQIVDSVEDDQVQNQTIDKETEKTKAESPPEESEKNAPTSCSGFSEESEKVMKEDSEELKSGLSQGSEVQRDRRPNVEEEKRESSPIKSKSESITQERNDKQTSTNVPESSLVTLDQVSDEEEEYPDDTAEKEELRKRQAAARNKQLANEQETRRTMDEVEVNAQELVTLDEVSADETQDETESAGQSLEDEVTEGEVQALVTIDEFVDEEPEGKPEHNKEEAPPPNQEDQSGDDLNQETLVTLDEACYDEEEKPEVEEDKKTSRPEKRKHDDGEQSMNFVIVDEIEEDEKTEAATLQDKTRGGVRKRARHTPATVTKSIREKNVSSQQEREEEKEPEEERRPASVKTLTSADKKTNKPTNDDQETPERKPESGAPSAGRETQPQNKTLEEEEGEKEGRRRTEIKAVSKQRRDPDVPEAKRSRSQSPSVPSDFKLPAFRPSNPLGKEFVVQGFFCKVCSVFYLNENTAKEVHCSSQKHYDKLQKHYQKLREKSSQSSEQTSQDFLPSDPGDFISVFQFLLC